MNQKKLGQIINSITDASLKKNTKKVWEEWIEILKNEGASGWTHQEIVAFLKKKHKQTTWWQQMIASGYEVAVGKRVPGQSLKGTYSLTVTKTIPGDAKTVWKWLTSRKGLEYWLKPLSHIDLVKGATFEIAGGVFGEVRTIAPRKRIRLTWLEEDWVKATTVQVFIQERPGTKTMVVFQHEGLLRPKQKSDLRMYWRNIIDGLPLEMSNK